VPRCSIRMPAMWTTLTPVPGANEVLARLRSQAAAIEPSLSPEARTLINGGGTPADVARCWRSLLDADSHQLERDPARRNLLLVALFDRFETLRNIRYRELKEALGNLPTATGKPMSVIGTRCELASRAAEGLYTEFRRTPGSPSSQIVIPFIERLLTAVLTDCRQRDNPNYAKRWLGIRGVCRLMTAVRKHDEPNELQLELYSAAADDLEKAFQLGNRGSSAAAFLLDALSHVIAPSDTQEHFARLQAVVNSLTSAEKNNRSVLLFVARYQFARSFREEHPLPSLREALANVDTALTFPPDLSSDDDFVRLIRGQILVRISLSTGGIDSDQGLQALSAGITDLQAAVENAPHRFAKQASLPSALHSRAKYFIRSGRYAEAKADAAYVTSRPDLAAADPPATRQLEFIDLLANLRRAHDENDLDSLEAALRDALEHPQAATQGVIALGLAARHLFFNRGPSDDPSLLRRTIEVLEAGTLPDDLTSRRMHLSLKARLHLLYGTVWSPSALEIAAKSALAATELCSETPEPELLSMAGECCLRLAKRLLAEERQQTAAEYFEQAAEYFARAVTAVEAGTQQAGASFQLVVAHSKAGEAWLRLCRLAPSVECTEKAVSHFQKAHALGNRTPELVGLLGDAYYQSFRLTGNREMLDLAIGMKAEAKDSGHTTRENLSLSAKLLIRKWEHSGDPADLVSAIVSCANAHEVSPTWPWPAFQLAELLERARLPEGVGEVPALSGDHGTKLVKLLWQGSDALIRYGCELVVADEEFKKRTLGGRQSVYVLEDPHRLLGASYVFKHTAAASAQRDRATIQGFSEFLRERGIVGLALPRPIAIVSTDGSNRAVYVMRRAPGFHLGRLAVRALGSGLPVPVEPFERALMFLAAFHAWGDTLTPGPPASALGFVKEYLRDTLGVPTRAVPAAIFQELKAVGHVPDALKKDAHPENWLIDERGRLAMLDFESTKRLPVPFEVVQLLDDYPVIPVTEEGWQRRIVAARRYIALRSQFSGSQISLSDESLAFLYGVCLVLRAKFGLRQVAGDSRNLGSSAALRATSVRREHYREVAYWLAAKHPHAAIRDFAVIIES
jgi:tetratricopeptide (TPR) repeat protein